METDKRKKAVAILSVISNAILVIAKLTVGLIIGSVSVISEAIHSAVDLLAAGIALFSVSRSGKPSDVEHPFGHGKVENISGAIEAVLIFVAALWIIYEAVERLIHPAGLEYVGLGVSVMLISSLVNMYVSKKLFIVGRETSSMALVADAWHLRTDVWTAGGVMIGLGLIWIGESIFPGNHFHWIDPLAAVIVAIFIIRTAIKLTIETGRDLLDASLPSEEIVIIEKIISQHAAQWCEFHDLRTRRSGSVRFVEFHLLVDPAMSVERSHELTDRISAGINNKYANTDVNIHIEPCEKNHTEHFGIQTSAQ